LHHPEIKTFYEDNRYFISCEASLTPTLLLSAIASGLGLKVTGERDGLLSQVIAALQNIKLPALLVLDSFETCWNCGKRHEVQGVLDRLNSLPNVAFMVTMRSSSRPDGIFWTKALPLKALDPSSAQQVFREVAGEIEDLDVGMLDGLLRKVEYLPQAVVLLARLTLRGETVASLCDRWELEGTSIISPPTEDYHYNLNASFHLSITSHPMKSSPYALRLLSTLACLPNGISRKSLKEVTRIPQDQIHHAAQTLNEVGLAEYDNETLKVIAPIRQYVSQYHPPPPGDVLKTRHHYRSLISRVQNNRKWRESSQTLETIEPELGNIYETLSRWIRSSERMDEATSVVLHLSKFLFTASDRTALLGRIVKDQTDKLSLPMRAALFHMHGMSLDLMEDYSSARHSLECARDIYSMLKDSAGRSACCCCIGDIHRYHGQYQEALVLLQSALAGYRELGNRCLGGQAACLCSLAEVYRVLGDSEVGFLAAAEASHIYQKLNDRTGVISATLLCASIEMSRNNLSEARELLDTISGECQHRRHPTHHKNYLLQRGKLFCSMASQQEADGYLSQALSLYTSNSRASKQGRADALRYLGIAALQRAEDMGVAEQYFQDAQEIYQTLDNKLNIAKIRSCLGHLYLRKGKNHWQDAESSLITARDLFSHIGCRREYAECLVSIAEIKTKQDHQAEASKLFQGAGDTHRKLRNSSQAAVCQETVEELTETTNELIMDESAGLAAEGARRMEEGLTVLTSMMGW
jgi:tetratricopeptide (TPR) repeat protein